MAWSSVKLAHGKTIRMKILSILLPTVMLCLCFIAWQNFDNSMREIRAREIINVAKEGVLDEYASKAVDAISLLHYRNIFGHEIIVNPELIATILVSINDYVSDKSNIPTYFKQAVEYYLVAIKSRPAFGNYWSVAAQLKWTIGQVDSDFNQYLSSAHEFGKYNYMVHVNLVSLGKYMINEENTLTEEQKKIFFHHVKYGLLHKRSKNIIKKLLTKNEQAHKVFCSWINDSENIYQFLRCN